MNHFHLLKGSKIKQWAMLMKIIKEIVMEENNINSEVENIEEVKENTDKKEKKHAKGLLIFIIIMFVLVMACFITLLVLENI